MRLVGVWSALALGIATMSAAALADDPHDASMRSAAARARDHERIREMNLAQLRHVQERDARYAEGWNAYREAHHGAADRRKERRRHHRR